MKYVHAIEATEGNPWSAQVEIEVPPHHVRISKLVEIGALNLKKDGLEDKQEWFSKNAPVLIKCYESLKPYIKAVSMSGPGEERASGLENFEVHPAFEMAFIELGSLFIGGFGPGKN